MIENLVKGGEWFLTLDDNIDRFTGVRRESYEQAELPVERGDFDRSIYNHNLTATEFLARLELDRKHCEATGIHYAGMAVVDNYYFRSVKYRYVGYVISKAAMIHNVGVPYDPNVTAMDDYAFTAEHLKRFGKVLINNYLFPVAGHYEPGGIGTYQERQPAKIKDSEYLMRKYPGLFRYKSKKGCHPKAELQVRFTTLSQVESWRTGFF